MKVVVVEDELAAVENLTHLLLEIDPAIEVLENIDTVTNAVQYFSNPHAAELVFMDIHLADGLSFEIFEQVQLTIPVIFTTAYDQYAIQAFKVNSLDYLLKPIDEEELKGALDQYHERKDSSLAGAELRALREAFSMTPKKYRTTFLVNHRDGMVPVKSTDISFFFIDTGIVYATTITNQKYSIDRKLEEIEEELDPQQFKRANRQFIVNRETLVNIKFYFNGKLIVNTQPPSPERIVVSKARATEFKNWVNQ